MENQDETSQSANSSQTTKKRLPIDFSKLGFSKINQKISQLGLKSFPVKKILVSFAVIIVVFIILSIAIRVLRNSNGNGGVIAPADPTPTPTPKSEIINPSEYADDPEVQAIDVQIKDLEAVIDETDLDETKIHPPTFLDFNINF